MGRLPMTPRTILASGSSIMLDPEPAFSHNPVPQLALKSAFSEDSKASEQGLHLSKTAKQIAARNTDYATSIPAKVSYLKGQYS